MWDVGTMVTLWTYKIWVNSFVAYYFTKDTKIWISYNWHTIYIKGVTTKDHALDLLKKKFNAPTDAIKFFDKLDLRKLKIPEKK